jgi:3-oxoacyl-[acyl-carrier-protein] synthase II
VLAPKLSLGEPMGAGGALNAALAVLAWQAPNARPADRPVLVNSASFGGTNFSLVLAPTGGDDIERTTRCNP